MQICLVFMKLEDIVDIAALSKEDRMKYDESIKVFRDNLVTEAFAKNEGRAEGRAEGLAEGERNERLRNARNFKNLGVSVDIISQATGLTVDEILSL